MRTMRSTWPTAVAGAVLIGAGLLMNYGGEVISTGAQAASANHLTVMIDKLNQAISPVGKKTSVERSGPPVDARPSSASRFVMAFPGAVLDKQTGLVWEEVPDAAPKTWTAASRSCVDKAVGGTIGWRLPSMAELKSVQDPSMAPPFVPAGVFTDVQSIAYWSASKASISVSFVHLVNGRVSGGNTPRTFPVWCVRGGVNTEQY